MFSVGKSDRPFWERMHSFDRPSVVRASRASLDLARAFQLVLLIKANRIKLRYLLYLDLN